MTYYITLALGALCLAWISSNLLALNRNIRAAKRSGLPYYIIPLSPYSLLCQITIPIWMPWLKRLPHSWTHPWITFLSINWPWTHAYRPFAEAGSDALIVVCPRNALVYVADPDAIVQISARRNDFPKPIEIYKAVDLFGKNVVSTEGSTWRQHRKITSIPFTDRSNQLVWDESLHQVESMLTSWMGSATDKSMVVADVAAATMRLSLHIISRAGFGMRLQWPHEDKKGMAKDTDMTNGHTMTFKDSLSTVLEDLLPLIVLPKWALSIAPTKSLQHTLKAWKNWEQYMYELYNDRKAEIKSGKVRDGMDLMGAIVKGAGLTTEALNLGDTENASQPSGQLLSDDEILGNSFVVLLAGHETTSNVIQFSLLYLAMYPDTQQRLQNDIDETLGPGDPSTWDYDRDVPKLMGTMTGAVMNETLRLIPPVIGIPKKTTTPQPLTVGDKRIVVPANSPVSLVATAVQRNPKYWPTMCGPDATVSEIAKDLDTFKPERWMSKNGIASSSAKSDTNQKDPEAQHVDEAIEGPQGPDTSAHLFQPKRGSYIPFSEGARACLGRRFAQVEILAVLAYIFKSWTVELAVDDLALRDKRDVASLTSEEKTTYTAQALANAQDLLTNGMGTIITLQMRKGKVPLRFVRR